MKMGEDLQFQQRWEFRRTDSELHSSSDNSKSSCEPVLKKNKLVPGLLSFEEDEVSGTSRLLQENGNQETSLPVKPGKTKTKRRRNENVGELQGDCLEGVGPKKGKARTNDAATMEKAKKFMESLFDDLKVATENLFTWMTQEMYKLLEDHSGPGRMRRRRGNGNGGVKGQIKHHKRSTMNPKGELKKPLKQPTHIQQPENLQEKKPQGYDLQSSNNLVERRNAPNTCNPYNSIEMKIDNGQATEPVGSAEQDKGKKMPFFANSQSQTSPTAADRNLQLQTQSKKTVVLAIEAQNSNIEKTTRRKRVVHCDEHCTLTDKQLMRTPKSGGNTNKKIPETSPGQSFVSNPANLLALSSHSTSLSELQDSVLGHDASGEKKKGLFLERPNQMLDLNSFRGYFPRFQSEERSLGSFGQPISRNLVPFGQISGSSSSMGPGFLVPHHPGMDVGCSLANQVNQGSLGGKNGNTMGLTMNEGAIKFSGGNYSLLEHFVADHQQSNRHSGFNPPEGRLLSYQIPNIREGPHFSK